MTTAFLDITAAIVEALSATPAVLAAARIRRGRRVPVPAEWSQAIDINLVRALGDSDADTLDGEELRWVTTVGIELCARASATADAETAVDPLLQAVFTRMAAATPPVGVIEWTLQPTAQWEPDEADTTVVRLSLVLRVVHQTDLTLAALAD